MTTATPPRPAAETAALDTRFFGHPRGLSTLFFTEMWERFSYYGMRALLILFMTAPVTAGGLGFDTAKAGPIYALYVSSVYLLSLPGGWVAVAPKRLVPPATLRRYLEGRCDELGVSRAGVPFEGATLEVAYHGSHFAGGVHLAGDAAGAISSLTAEGIYAALVTGEEVARTILEPHAPSPKTASWLRKKRWHDRLARRLARPAARDRTLGLFARIGEMRWLRRPLASWLLRG